MLPELISGENKILKQIAFESTKKEISYKLSIGESNFENHIHHIYIKLGVSNKAQAVPYVFQLKIILPNHMMDNRGNYS